MVGIRLQISPQTRAALAKMTPEETDKAVGSAIFDWLPGVRRTLAVNSPGSRAGNTGNFRRRWNVRQPAKNRVEIWNTAKYGPFVEEDTKPHVIRPVRAKMLAWRPGAGRVSAFRASAVYKRASDWVRALVVNHPGTKGQHPLQRSVEQEAPKLLALLAERVNGVFGGGLR